MKRVIMSSTTPLARDGISNVMLNLYQHIDKEKIHIDFISINEPEESIKKKIQDGGGKYTVIPRSMKHLIKYILEYARVCKGYDIVHVHGNSATMFLEMLAAKLAGVNFRIAHSHSTYCLSNKINRIFKKPFLSLCNGRVACGEKAGKWLFEEQDFILINNGIDVEKYRFNDNDRKIVRNKLGWDECKIIGHVGNFTEAKNHSFIVDVFFQLSRRNPNVRLLLIGSGQYMDEIEKKVDEAGIGDKVYFTGSVSNISDYLNAMDLVFMPSKYEGFPLSLLEEQANGLCCICSDRITEEANFTGRIQYISLDDEISCWVQTLSENLDKCEKEDRNVLSDTIIDTITNAGFNISDSAKKLEEIYECNR